MAVVIRRLFLEVKNLEEQASKAGRANLTLRDDFTEKVFLHWSWSNVLASLDVKQMALKVWKAFGSMASSLDLPPSTMLHLILIQRWLPSRKAKGKDWGWFSWTRRSSTWPR